MILGNLIEFDSCTRDATFILNKYLSDEQMQTLVDNSKLYKNLIEDNKPFFIYVLSESDYPNLYQIEGKSIQVIVENYVPISNKNFLKQSDYLRVNNLKIFVNIQQRNLVILVERVTNLLEDKK
jgi:hypothetical protein